jgi:hypothetical protein
MRPKRDSFTPSNQPPSHSAESVGWTKQELMEASELSPKTFDTIRKAARVRGPSHGGLSWVFSRADVEALIQRAESGTFTERGPPAAAAWRKLLAGEAE